MRPNAIVTLLESVKIQTVYPTEIIIVDGSTDNQTTKILKESNFDKLIYYKVSKEDRGLTRQRNFGINKVTKETDIVCFLDDDTVLTKNYFEEILKTFISDDEIVGVGGLAINQNRWKIKDKNYNKLLYYEFDGYIIKESSRNVIRNILGIQSNLPPSRMPEFSNVRTYGYPFNNKTYEVDLLVGMSFSFRKKVVDTIKFSKYFEGYGLYEDADFSIRAQKFGKNVINTKVQLYHYHASEGRPNKYNYGKMVVRNGWYVWRLKYPNPSIMARCKWNIIVITLIYMRFLNVFTTKKRKEAFTEFLGRKVGLLSLLFNKPTIIR